ncbi:MAG: RimK family protein [Myxococcales bacterium]|nr:RimK family protein [Myxococcales bacterium]
MIPYLVLDDPEAWDLELPGVEVVAARDYLTDPRFSQARRVKVFNLCQDYRYQTTGYYVSLVAAARGHKPLPQVATFQDLRSAPVVRLASQELDAKIQKALKNIKSDKFVLSVYFGRNIASRYDTLSRALFNLFPAPLLRATFERGEERWRVVSIRPIAMKDIPESHKASVVEHARRYFERPTRSPKKRYRYDLAILTNPEEVDAPSDAGAIQRFIKAANSLGIDARVISKDDYGRLAEYDGLFIRETTSVPHHTFRFAQRAQAEGLVVIDDPESILRCTNKVFQAELFARYELPCPKTVLVDEKSAKELPERLSFPMVLKQPDSAFSLGVKRADNPEQLQAILTELFDGSELVVAQEYTPSAFDWRVGILDGKPLFACRYHMAKGHWQIQKNLDQGKRRFGKVDTLPLEEVPKKALNLAVEAASHVGNGLYGVDVKEVNKRFLIMEINDNPNIDHGYEDRFLGDKLYTAVMQVFLDRMEARSGAESKADEKEAR